MNTSVAARQDSSAGAPDDADRGGRALILAWLVLVSAVTALAVTVLLFDRTTLGGVTGRWLGSFALLFVLGVLWWVRPRLYETRLRFSCYEPRSLSLVTVPLYLAGLAVVGGAYLSDEVHNELYHRFYHLNLVQNGDVPVVMLALVLCGCCLLWVTRDILEGIGEGSRRRFAAARALSNPAPLLALGTVALGLLLGTVSLSMINVNFWRYWATADGWAVVGAYPSTLTDTLHVQQGGVSEYFVSFPLLPAMLTASFGALGHNTLGAHLPMVLGSVLLPLAAFLLLREIVRDSLLAFLFSSLVASFPLLRGYTLNVAEADGLFITSLLLAAYLHVRSSRPGALGPAAILAGLAAGMATLARPEGVLYTLAMYVVALKDRWRERGFWVSACTWMLCAAGFVFVSLREFGMIWPGNHSGTIRLSNFGETLAVVMDSGILGLYAKALGISESALAIALVLTVAALAFSAARMARRDFGILFMPLTAVGNVVMVFFVGPVPAEAAKFHDFFRHISYGVPFMAVTLAYGASAMIEAIDARWARWLVPAALAGLVWAQLSLLQGPVTPGGSGSPVMTSDIHVSAIRLATNPYALPVM